MLRAGPVQEGSWEPCREDGWSLSLQQDALGEEEAEVGKPGDFCGLHWGGEGYLSWTQEEVLSSQA